MKKRAKLQHFFYIRKFLHIFLQNLAHVKKKQYFCGAKVLTYDR